MFKRISLALALLAVSCASVGAIQGSTIQVRKAYDYEALTVPGTATPFTSSKVTPTSPSSTDSAELATFTVNCASGTTCILRFTIDGTNTPTASVGLRALYGDTVSVYGHANIVNFKGIRETGTSVVLDVVYFK